MYQTRTSTVDANGITQYTINTFTVDQIIPCETDPNSPSVLQIPLQANGVWVGLLQDNADPSLLVQNRLTISNLKNPSIFGTYSVSLVVYTSASTSALETYSTNVVVTPPAFVLSMIPYSYLASDTNLVEFKFNAPIDMPKANRALGNYFDEFTRLEFTFKQKDAGPPILDMFDYDLGYVSSAGGTSTLIPCWASDDVLTYGGGLKCKLTYGKTGTITTSDKVVVSVSNYKALKANDRVSVSFMFKNAMPTALASASVTGALINIVTNEEFIIGQNTLALTKTNAAAPPAFGTFTVTPSTLEVQASIDISISISLATGPYLSTDTPAFVIKIPSTWDFSTSIFQPTQVFLDGVQLFTGKFYYNSYNKILYITPKDDIANGAHTIQLKRIVGPQGANAVNTFDVSFYSVKLPIYKSNSNAGAITCYPIPSAGLAISSDIPKYSAKGASYFFTWTAGKYYTKPIIVIAMPSAVTEYLFGPIGTHSCTLEIDGVEQRIDISPYQQVCVFPAGLNTFTMTLSKDIPSGTVVTVVLRYIDHPAANPATTGSITVQSQITDPYLLTTTAYSVECNTFSLTSTNLFTSGVFVASLIDLKAIWGTPLHSSSNVTLFFDFEIQSFLPKGTQIEIGLPTDFTKLAYRVDPRCYLRGQNKMLKSCIADETAGSMKIQMDLMDDFLPNVPMTLEYYGYANFLKAGWTSTTNTIGPFTMKATFNSKILAQTPATPTFDLQIYDTIGRIIVT